MSSYRFYGGSSVIVATILRGMGSKKKKKKKKKLGHFRSLQTSDLGSIILKTSHTSPSSHPLHRNPHFPSVKVFRDKSWDGFIKWMTPFHKSQTWSGYCFLGHWEKTSWVLLYGVLTVSWWNWNLDFTQFDSFVLRIQFDEPTGILIRLPICKVTQSFLTQGSDITRLDDNLTTQSPITVCKFLGGITFLCSGLSVIGFITEMRIGVNLRKSDHPLRPYSTRRSHSTVFPVSTLDYAAQPPAAKVRKIRTLAELMESHVSSSRILCQEMEIRIFRISKGHSQDMEQQQQWIHFQDCIEPLPGLPQFDWKPEHIHTDTEPVSYQFPILQSLLDTNITSGFPDSFNAHLSPGWQISVEEIEVADALTHVLAQELRVPRARHSPQL